MTAVTQENKQVAETSKEKVEQNQSVKAEIPQINAQPQAKQEVAQPVIEDENFKSFREARKKDRAEKEEAIRRAAEKEAEVAALKAAMEAAFAKQPAQPSSYYGGDNQHEETEDEKINKKVEAAIAARDAALERQRQERDRQELPVRLQRDFPDFNQVVSQENLDYIDYHYPEIARPLNRLQDGYEKWSDIYHAVKKFVPNSLSAKKEAARAEMNQQKPRSLSSSGVTQPQPTPGSHILSEEKRAANWARMQKTLKGVG
jgi:hypothetical protein